MPRTIIIFTAAAAAAAQSGSLCVPGEPLACLSWSSANGNVTFTATYNGFENAPMVWGAWGISEIFCGNMFPATVWLTYVTTSGAVVVEDRHTVAHIEPVCYPRQLSQQLSGSVSNNGTTLTASWTRPIIVPADFAEYGYMNLTNTNVPLIAAVNYGGPAAANVSCNPLLPPHEVAFGGLSGNILGVSKRDSMPRCNRLAPNATRVTRRAAVPALPAAHASRNASAPYSGLVSTFAICSTTVSVLGYLGYDGSVLYQGSGTGSAMDYIAPFDTAIDPAGRTFYALASSEGAVETVTLFAFSVDTGAAVSSCATPFYSPMSLGSNMFLAWDTASSTLLASGCIDAKCAQAVPIGFLTPGSCAFKQVATLGTLSATLTNFESAVYNNDTMQVVYSVSHAGGVTLYAADLVTGVITSFNETSTHNIDSLTYDSASGLIFGVGQQGTVASLVALNSSTFAFDVRGVIGDTTVPFASIGALGGSRYYFLAAPTAPPFSAPLLTAVDIVSGAVVSSTPIAYCEYNDSDCPRTLEFQP